MLVDTQPATYQHNPASDEVREQWVNAQLVGVVMDNAMPALLSATFALPVMVYLMWGEVNNIALTTWALLLLSVLAHRFWMIGTYRMRYDHVEGPLRTEFVRRYRWSWAAVGLLWGATVGITFQQSSIQAQFACGLIVLGHGLISLTVFSADLRVFRAYSGAMIVSVLLGLVVPTVLLPVGPDGLKTATAMVFLLLIFWWLLNKAGERTHHVHRSSFELQFSNQELIDSLTQQTRTSLQAVTTKNRFLASAAHDLRQPVHALSLYADWLASEPEMASEIAPRILQSTRAINELFDSLFDLTRIDAGNYKVRLQHVNVGQLFADLALQFEPVAQAKSLELRTRASDTSIWADPVVLRRILGNLVSNALRHTHHGGVLLALRRQGEVLAFEVWDTGVGIAREHQQAIFQEFFRVTQHQGTEDSLGLGLTIVSKLSTLMGYQLALSSQANKGSVFRVMLPAFTQQDPYQGQSTLPLALEI